MTFCWQMRAVTEPPQPIRFQMMWFLFLKKIYKFLKHIWNLVIGCIFSWLSFASFRIKTPLKNKKHIIWTILRFHAPATRRRTRSSDRHAAHQSRSKTSRNEIQFGIIFLHTETTMNTSYRHSHMQESYRFRSCVLHSGLNARHWPTHCFLLGLVFNTFIYHVHVANGLYACWIRTPKNKVKD